MEFFFVLFPVVFFIVIAFFILMFVGIIKQTRIQKNSPILSSEAKLISKRDYHSSSFTYYYGTFEFPSGDRLELELPREKAGLIVEGDQGQLTYKGSRMVDFVYESDHELY